MNCFGNNENFIVHIYCYLNVLNIPILINSYFQIKILKHFSFDNFLVLMNFLKFHTSFSSHIQNSKDCPTSKTQNRLALMITFVSNIKHHFSNFFHYFDLSIKFDFNDNSNQKHAYDLNYQSDQTQNLIFPLIFFDKFVYQE